jgi:hypothetical protein
LYPVADFSKKQAKKWPKVLKIAYFWKFQKFNEQYRLLPNTPQTTIILQTKDKIVKQPLLNKQIPPQDPNYYSNKTKQIVQNFPSPIPSPKTTIQTQNSIFSTNYKTILPILPKQLHDSK